LDHKLQNSWATFSLGNWSCFGVDQGKQILECYAPEKQIMGLEEKHLSAHHFCILFPFDGLVVVANNVSPTKETCAKCVVREQHYDKHANIIHIRMNRISAADFFWLLRK
jgi:hypothetical protein